MIALDTHAAFAADVLNAMRGSVAVLDSHGIIVAVNEAWTRFARDHGCADGSFYVGSDYLAVSEKVLSHGGADDTVRAMLRDLRSVIEGDLPDLTAEFSIMNARGTVEWIQVTATRLGSESGGVVLYHEDITGRKTAEQTLQETAQKLRTVLEALPIGVWLVDAAGRIVESNRAGQAIWAGARYVGPDQFGIYKGWWRSTGQPVIAEEWAAARAISRGEISMDEEIEIECFDGSRKVILNSAIPLFDEHKAVRGAIIVNQDVTARIQADEELRRAKEAIETAGRELAEVLIRERTLARVDSLTGALNRRRFFELAEYEISVATRYHRELSIILFDLDEFKAINDRVGHQAGDDLLKGVVQVVTAHLRQADVLARYGGDEFVILLPHTRAPEAAIVAERMRSDISEQSIATAGGEIVSTRISAGVAEFQGPGDGLDALILRADAALYHAKNSGRNRVAIHGRDTPRHPV